MMKHNHKKKYGQNFLDSKEILDKIDDSINLNGEEVLEIGAGQGFLTGLLLDKSSHLYCYEIDTDLIPYLTKKFKNYSNFTLINQDFLDAEIKGSNLKVIANIPYYITSPIIQKLIENRNKIDEIYLMVQKEVAQRICSNFNSKETSSFTHFVQFYAEPTYLFTVEKEYFTPIPKVDSAFIKLKIRKDNKYSKLIDDNLYFSFIKKAFSSKRKSLVNNLKNFYSKDKLESLLSNKLVRAEELNIEEMIDIIKGLENDRF